MKKSILYLLIMLIGSSIFSQVNSNYHYVKGYYRSNGTHVKGYYRTNPNSSNTDNYSTSPNTNPWTGEAGTVTPDYKSNIKFNISADYPSSSTPRSSSGGYNNYAISYSSYPRYYCKTNANLRTNPGTNYPVSKNMGKYDYVRVLGPHYSNPSWWEVYYIKGNVKGYVYKSLLISDPKKSTTSLKLNPLGFNSDALRYSSYPRYYCKTNANLRTSPGTNYPISKNMEKYDYVRVLRPHYSNPNWWEVYYIKGNIEGYVYKNLLLPDTD